MCMCPKQGKAQAVRNPAVFFSPTNPRIHLFFSLIFLIIPHFGTILFFLNFGSALIGLVLKFLQKFIFPRGSFSCSEYSLLISSISLISEDFYFLWIFRRWSWMLVRNFNAFCVCGERRFVCVLPALSLSLISHDFCFFASPCCIQGRVW